MFFSSPLEQFEIVLLPYMAHFRSILSPLTQVTPTIYIVLLIYFTFFGSILYKSKKRFLYRSKLGEKIFMFVNTVVDEQAGKKGAEFFPAIFTIFNFVLISNLVGLVPFGFTITSHISFTFATAAIINISLFILGFVYHGFRFVYLVIPSGIPDALLPLVVVIEIISYFLRTVSLSVRLFANMLSGHILLHIVASFIVTLATTVSAFGYIVKFLPILIIIAIFFLELCIAFLQAYVFMVLICIYLKEAAELH